MLIGGCPLEEASEHGIHYGNKSFFLLVLLRGVAYVWYFSTNLYIIVLQVVSKPFPEPTHYGFFFSHCKEMGTIVVIVDRYVFICQ